MNFLVRLALLCVLCSFPMETMAHDPSHEHGPWYNTQTMNPETQQRLGVTYKSCCDDGDVVQNLKHRIVADGSKYGAETYEYWNVKDKKWKPIPPDTIRREKTPDGQPVLFINRHTNMELCFILDEDGI